MIDYFEFFGFSVSINNLTFFIFLKNYNEGTYEIRE